MNNFKQRADFSESLRIKQVILENIIVKIVLEASPRSLEMIPELCIKIIKFA